MINSLRANCQQLRQSLLAEGIEPEAALLVSLWSTIAVLDGDERSADATAMTDCESVNKIFQNWHRRGLIDLSKGSIMIRNVEAIERLI
jgi:hypothetical protein